MAHIINEQINVNAFYFKGQEPKVFPREIEYHGRYITFADGLRYLVKRGSALVKIFDMTAGDAIYRLCQEGDNWTLIATKGGC